jgi:pyruvate dehydrogenase E1 component beta subunit
MSAMTYAEAARLALAEEMRRDPLVWALGQDLGPEGGVAGQYKGLLAEFGPERIVDTPISEATMLGSVVGAAAMGTRPVCELRYADFGICAADQLVNQAAKMRYMFGGQMRVPLVVRQSIGWKIGGAAQHAQSTEAWWAHTPGLVVVCPATPRDNRGLLKAAIRCDDPVVYMENKNLWTETGDVPDAEEIVPLGVANIVRTGGDVTIVTWSRIVGVALEAAEALVGCGIEAEVIDLRTIWPWDRAAVERSLEKTGRLLVAHESVQAGGFGAEIAADMGERMHRRLRAPIRRIGGRRTPIPYSERLDEPSRVTVSQIVGIVESMI